MIKRDEIFDLTSCLNKAADDEPVFVLRAKDPVAISTILFWINRRIEDGCNKAGDAKTTEAMELLNQMIRWRDAVGLKKAMP